MLSAAPDDSKQDPSEEISPHVSQDFYTRLRIERTASLDEIKKAYRTLSLRYHPDKNKSSDAGDKFKLINQAYVMLSDAETREAYDFALQKGIDHNELNEQKCIEGESVLGSMKFEDSPLYIIIKRLRRLYDDLFTRHQDDLAWQQIVSLLRATKPTVDSFYELLLKRLKGLENGGKISTFNLMRDGYALYKMGKTLIKSVAQNRKVDENKLKSLLKAIISIEQKADNSHLEEQERLINDFGYFLFPSADSAFIKRIEIIMCQLGLEWNIAFFELFTHLPKSMREVAPFLKPKSLEYSLFSFKIKLEKDAKPDEFTYRISGISDEQSQPITRVFNLDIGLKNSRKNALSGILKALGEMNSDTDLAKPHNDKFNQMEDKCYSLIATLNDLKLHANEFDRVFEELVQIHAVFTDYEIEREKWVNSLDAKAHAAMDQLNMLVVPGAPQSFHLPEGNRSEVLNSAICYYLAGVASKKYAINEYRDSMYKVCSRQMNLFKYEVLDQRRKDIQKLKNALAALRHQYTLAEATHWLRQYNDSLDGIMELDKKLVSQIDRFNTLLNPKMPELRRVYEDYNDLYDDFYEHYHLLKTMTPEVILEKTKNAIAQLKYQENAYLAEIKQQEQHIIVLTQTVTNLTQQLSPYLSVGIFSSDRLDKTSRQLNDMKKALSSEKAGIPFEQLLKIAQQEEVIALMRLLGVSESTELALWHKDASKASKRVIETRRSEFDSLLTNRLRIVNDMKAMHCAKNAISEAKLRVKQSEERIKSVKAELEEQSAIEISLEKTILAKNKSELVSTESKEELTEFTIAHNSADCVSLPHQNESKSELLMPVPGEIQQSHLSVALTTLKANLENLIRVNQPDGRDELKDSAYTLFNTVAEFVIRVSILLSERLQKTENNKFVSLTAVELETLSPALNGVILSLCKQQKIDEKVAAEFADDWTARFKILHRDAITLNDFVLVFSQSLGELLFKNHPLTFARLKQYIAEQSQSVLALISYLPKDIAEKLESLRDLLLSNLGEIYFESKDAMPDRDRYQTLIKEYQEYIASLKSVTLQNGNVQAYITAVNAKKDQWKQLDSRHRSLIDESKDHALAKYKDAPQSVLPVGTLLPIPTLNESKLIEAGISLYVSEQLRVLSHEEQYNQAVQGFAAHWFNDAYPKLLEKLKTVAPKIEEAKKVLMDQYSPENAKKQLDMCNEWKTALVSDEKELLNQLAQLFNSSVYRQKISDAFAHSYDVIDSGIEHFEYIHKELTSMPKAALIEQLRKEIDLLSKCCEESATKKRRQSTHVESIKKTRDSLKKTRDSLLNLKSMKADAISQTELQLINIIHDLTVKNDELKIGDVWSLCGKENIIALLVFLGVPQEKHIHLTLRYPEGSKGKVINDNDKKVLLNFANERLQAVRDIKVVHHSVVEIETNEKQLELITEENTIQNDLLEKMKTQLAALEKTQDSLSEGQVANMVAAVVSPAKSPRLMNNLLTKSASKQKESKDELSTSYLIFPPGAIPSVNKAAKRRLSFEAPITINIGGENADKESDEENEMKNSSPNSDTTDSEPGSRISQKESDSEHHSPISSQLSSQDVSSQMDIEGEMKFPDQSSTQSNVSSLPWNDGVSQLSSISVPSQSPVIVNQPSIFSHQGNTSTYSSISEQLNKPVLELKKDPEQSSQSSVSEQKTASKPKLSSDGQRTQLNETNKKPKQGTKPKQKTTEEEIAEAKARIQACKGKAEAQTCFLEIMNGITDLKKSYEFYDGLKDIACLNEHRNPRIDTLFGIKNTTTWRATLDTMRKAALKNLLLQVDNCQDYGKKLDMLRTARNQAIFKDHRNNTIFKGAFGRTKSVERIDDVIEATQEAKDKVDQLSSKIRQKL